MREAVFAICERVAEVQALLDDHEVGPVSRQRSERQRKCAGNEPRQDVQHLYG
jgi:hypothetical protein